MSNTKKRVYKLNEIVNIELGERIVKGNSEVGQYPVYGGGDWSFHTNRFNREGTNIIIGRFALSPKCTRIVFGKLFLNDSGFTVSPKDEKVLNKKYLIFVIQKMNDIIFSLARGAGQQNLNMSDFENLEIEIPESIEEQKRIAEILTNVDENISNIEEEIKQLDNIKTGLVLKLTSKYEDVKSLSELGDIVGGLTYSPNDVVNEGGKIVLRSPNISEDGLLELKDIVRVEKNIGKSCLKHNDILICVRNGSKRLIGKSLLIDKRVEGESFGAFMSVFRTKYSRYIYNLFNSPIIKEQISKNLGATINQITNKDINEYRIPFPFDESDILIFNEVMENFLNLIEIKKKELKKLRNIKSSFLDMLI